MFELKLTSTVNAGVIFDFGGKRIWVDAIHDFKTRDFSCCSPEHIKRMMTDPKLCAPDLILFTHSHPDHFSGELTNEVLNKWPEAKVITPNPREVTTAIVPQNDEDEYDFDGLHVTFFRLTHDSPQFKNTPHRGILLEYEDRTLLFAGDVSVKSDELPDYLKKRPVAGGRIFAAFLNFPWLCIGPGREKIAEMNAENYIIDHIPLEGDDNWGYRKQFYRLLDQYREGRNIYAFGEAFTEVTLR